MFIVGDSDLKLSSSQSRCQYVESHEPFLFKHNVTAEKHASNRMMCTSMGNKKFMPAVPINDGRLKSVISDETSMTRMKKTLKPAQSQSMNSAQSGS